MNYEDACEETFTPAEAQREIEKHDTDGGWAAFVADVGDKAEYTGQEVLDWLGY